MKDNINDINLKKLVVWNKIELHRHQLFKKPELLYSCYIKFFSFENYTICIVESDNPKEIRSGVAKLNPKDKPNNAYGCRVAFGRAIKGHKFEKYLKLRMHINLYHPELQEERYLIHEDQCPICSKKGETK